MRCSVALTLALPFATTALADGIPEPSLVLYGLVTDPSAGGIPVTSGALAWVFQPAGGGAAFTVTGPLTNLNGQFSYVLRIPCETLIPGVPGSSATLELAASPTTYDRSQVTINGVWTGFVQPALSNLTLTATDRGRIERIDLTVNLFGNGLIPAAWQIQYFGHAGLNPFDDPTNKGMTLYADYRAGTDPTNPNSLFEILRVRLDPSGPFIDWSSVQGKFYTLQRAAALGAGFQNVQTHIGATAPMNSFHDTSGTGTGPYYYRIQVD